MHSSRFFRIKLIERLILKREISESHTISDQSLLLSTIVLNDYYTTSSTYLQCSATSKDVRTSGITTCMNCSLLGTCLFCSASILELVLNDLLLFALNDYPDVFPNVVCIKLNYFYILSRILQQVVGQRELTHGNLGKERVNTKAESVAMWMNAHFHLISDRMPDKNQIHLPSWENQKNIYCCYLQNLQKCGLERKKMLELVFSTRYELKLKNSRQGSKNTIESISILHCRGLLEQILKKSTLRKIKGRFNATLMCGKIGTGGK